METKKKVEQTVKEKDTLLGGKKTVVETETEIDRPLHKDVVEKTKKVIKE
jgi:hypothetical protein